MSDEWAKDDHEGSQRKKPNSRMMMMVCGLIGVVVLAIITGIIIKIAMRNQWDSYDWEVIYGDADQVKTSGSLMVKIVAKNSKELKKAIAISAPKLAYQGKDIELKATHGDVLTELPAAAAPNFVFQFDLDLSGMPGESNKLLEAQKALDIEVYALDKAVGEAKDGKLDEAEKKTLDAAIETAKKALEAAQAPAKEEQGKTALSAIHQLGFDLRTKEGIKFVVKFKVQEKDKENKLGKEKDGAHEFKKEVKRAAFMKYQKPAAPPAPPTK